METTNIKEPEFGSTLKTRRLKANRVYPGRCDEALPYTEADRTPGSVDYLKEIKAHVRSTSKICVERARYFTEAYRASEGEPEFIRRAKAFANILDKMTIYIQDDELIVGNFASSPDALPTYPELVSWWIEAAIEQDGFYGKRVTKEVREEFKEIHEYWKGKCLSDRVYNLLPKEIQENHWRFNGITFMDGQWEHYGPHTNGYQRLIEQGSNGIVKRAKARLEEIRAERPGKDKSATEWLNQQNALQGIIIAHEAVARYGKRYAKLALEMAKKEKDATRKKELEEIAEVCDWVPANPARTFREALQCLWFHHYLDIVVQNWCCAGGCRFDTLMNPYYQKDKAEGKITREQAIELMECAWIKWETVGSLIYPEGEMLATGATNWQTHTLGGINEKGEDATNEMSYMMLDTTLSIRTIQPTFVLRYHPKIDPGIVDKCIDVIRTGIGFPAIISDTQCIPMMLRRGVLEEEAWNWNCSGCVAHSIPNKNIRTKKISEFFFGVGKALDLALHDGYCRWTGKQLGPKTGDPRKFESIEDFKEAYLKQVYHATEIGNYINMLGDELTTRYFNRPFTSGVIDGCIEQAKDSIEWSYCNDPEVYAVGMINVANSLTAIKKLVFDDKEVTIDEIMDALDNNWKGYEILRQKCLNAPKFGNDDDYADDMARWVQYATAAEVGKFHGYYGGQYWLDGGVASMTYSFARACAATPDGRLDSAPYADGTVSPMAGTDVNGPTATIKSVGKILPNLAHNMLLNQKFMPQFLEGENKKVFADYLKTWHDEGCYHVQFNCVDRDVLIDAQKHPENHPGLIVRVAGYSAYWVDLAKSVQDDIILRTPQAFGGC